MSNPNQYRTLQRPNGNKDDRRRGKDDDWYVAITIWDRKTNMPGALGWTLIALLIVLTLVLAVLAMQQMKTNRGWKAPEDSTMAPQSLQKLKAKNVDSV